MRVLAGALLEAPGLGLVVMRMVGQLSGTWPYVAGIVLLVLGQALIVAGILGRCPLRAVGMKTPL